MKLSSMTISKRLMLSFMALTALVILGGGITWWTVAAMQGNLQKYNREVSRKNETLQVQACIIEIYSDMADTLSDPSPEARQQSLENIKNNREEYNKLLDNLLSTAQTAEGKRLMEAIRTATTEAKDANNQVLKLLADGRLSEAAIQYHSVTQKYQKGVEDAVKACVDFRDERIKAVQNDSAMLAVRVRWISGIAILLAVALSVFLAWSASSFITREHARLRNQAESLNDQIIQGRLRTQGDVSAVHFRVQPVDRRDQPDHRRIRHSA